VTGAIFSFSTGVIHTYYTVALAPAIAALVAIGAALLWEHRGELWSRAIAAATVAGTGAWSYALLERTPSWEPWLRTLVAAGTVVAAVGLIAAPAFGRHARRAAVLSAIAVAVACFAGPIAYAAQTITSSHTGSLPSAGPTVTSASRGFGGPGGGSGQFPGGPPGGSGGGLAGGSPTAASGSGAASSLFGSGSGRRSLGAGGDRASFAHARIGGAGAGGVTVSSALADALEQNASHYRWVAATSGSSTAAAIELATDGKPVMAIGGFNGNGGELTLAQFEAYVAKGEIHYYIDLGGGFGGGFGGATGSTSDIATWVASHFKSEAIGGVSVYVLT
jgi:hypothetical protein